MEKSHHHTEEDYALMLRAIRLACKGSGFVRTNPLVGAIVVYQGNVIAQAWHAGYGAAHAEKKAISIAQRKYSPQQLRKATLYVTLEPCTQQGKTPPCLPIVKNSGIQRIVIGSVDPNPAEKGRSIRELRRAGLTVVTGVAKVECDYLIRAFKKWITTKRPFVLAKVGMSLDGKITQPLHQRYITNEKSLRRVHELRQEMDAILVGVNTIIRDNPRLNTRLPKTKLSHPIKVIMDSRLRMSPSSKALDDNTIIVCLSDQPLARKRALARTGADIIELPPVVKSGKLLFEHMNINTLLMELGKRNITSLIIEGGSYVFTTFINEKVIDEMYLFMAPYLYGATHLPFTYALKYTVNLKNLQFEQLDDNMLVRGYAQYH